MRKQDAVYIALCVGAIAFAFTFAYPLIDASRVPWFYVLERAWAVEARPTGVAIDFYGRLLYAVMAWCIAFTAALTIAKRMRGVSARTLHLFTAWALTATVLVMAFYAWHLYFRVLAPEPLPSWYVPR